MAYRISGRVLAVGQPQNLTAKSGAQYLKQDLVITVRKFDPYTGEPTDESGNTPKFTFFGDKCRDLANLRLGDIVTVSFEIAGRSYEKDGRTEYFTEVRPFGINTTEGKVSPVAANVYSKTLSSPDNNLYQPQPQNSSMEPQKASTDDDLPF